MNETAAKKIAEDFKVLINDAEDLIAATASQTGERIGDLRQRLQTKIEDARKGMAEKTWFRKVQRAKAGAESCLGKNSWAGLVIAVGVGALFGLLLRRK
jgi:ElaB/YqjD/DUF883 family membrane-anchored ribosome-binding protein